MSLDNTWEQAKAGLKKDLGDTLYFRWIDPINVCKKVQDTILLAVPTKFMKDWVNDNYLNHITNNFKSVDSSVNDINFMVIDDTTSNQTMVVDKKIESNTLKFSISVDSKLTFDKFIVAPSNEFAYSAAVRVVNSDTIDFNPLFLHSNVGLGKTHLMNAIANEFKAKQPEKKVLYISAEKFMHEFVSAIQNRTSTDFKNTFRSVDVLLIDDIQFMCGKQSTQDEFFQTFNALIDQNKQIILSADKSPVALDGLEERLKTRLGWGLVADIHSTTYELRLGVLKNKLEKVNTPVSLDVLYFLAENITSNIRELEGAFNRIVAHSQLMNVPVTLQGTKALLQDVLKANIKKLTISDIQKAVTSHYNIKLSEMFSSRRNRSIARPRQAAMFLCKELTSHSLPEIGKKFGNRDHTTVMHAIKTINKLLATDPDISQDIDIIKRHLG